MLLTSVNIMRIEQLSKIFDTDSNLIRHRDSLLVAQQSLEYSILLLRRNHDGDSVRSVAIIKAVLATQMHEPEWDRGRFPFMLPETWRDLNATLFLIPDMVNLYNQWQSYLGVELILQLRAALLAAVDAVCRRWDDEVFDVHRDFTSYSNIFILYIQALLMLGKCLDIERLMRNGEAQWKRWFNHVSTYGIDEFCSPTYNEVVYDGLLGILKTTTNMRMQKEVRLILDHMYSLQHAVSHPLMRIGVVGNARDYRVFVTPGSGAFRFLDSTGDANYSPPLPIREKFANRSYPYRAEGRSSIVPFRFKTWQLHNAAMGSMTGGHYFPQQNHLMIAVGTSDLERDCAFFQCDERNPINGYVCQQDHRALCLFARTSTSYHIIQLGQSSNDLPFPDTQPSCIGLTNGWNVTTHESGYVSAKARGYTLHLRSFSLDGEILKPVSLLLETVILNGQKISRWCAPADVVWFACMIELLPNGVPFADSTLYGSISDKVVELGETGGLTLRLARRTSGELVELYDQDWRTIPLFTSPDYHLDAGDFVTALIE